jgi:hypothetical protein
MKTRLRTTIARLLKQTGIQPGQQLRVESGACTLRADQLPDDLWHDLRLGKGGNFRRMETRRHDPHGGHSAA